MKRWIYEQLKYHKEYERKSEKIEEKHPNHLFYLNDKQILYIYYRCK